jgi:hypothetical protein
MTAAMASRPNRRKAHRIRNVSLNASPRSRLVRAGNLNDHAPDDTSCQSSQPHRANVCPRRAAPRLLALRVTGSVRLDPGVDRASIDPAGAVNNGSWTSTAWAPPPFCGEL